MGFAGKAAARIRETHAETFAPVIWAGDQDVQWSAGIAIDQSNGFDETENRFFTHEKYRIGINHRKPISTVDETRWACTQIMHTVVRHADVQFHFCRDLRTQIRHYWWNVPKRCESLSATAWIEVNGSKENRQTSESWENGCAEGKSYLLF